MGNIDPITVPIHKKYSINTSRQTAKDAKKNQFRKRCVVKRGGGEEEKLYQSSIYLER
jgi:hypothetical protein